MNPRPANADAHAAAHYRQGLSAHEKRRYAEAAAHFQRAIDLQPDVAGFYNSLGMTRRAQRRLDEAVAAYGRALELAPGLAPLHNNLGNAWRELGRLDRAIDCFRRAVELMPEFPMAHNHLGVALKESRRLAEAAAALRRALELAPGYAEAWCNLADALAAAGELEEAVGAYRRAIELKPDYAQACNNLGNALRARGDHGQAVAMYRRAIELRPEGANTHANLASVLDNLGHLDEAADCCRRALELAPDLPAAHATMASILKDSGDLSGAVAWQRRLLKLTPHDALAHSNLIYYLHFLPESDPQSLWEEARRWNAQHARPLADAAPALAADAEPGRRLRLGYVSPDFNRHPVARFLLPLLEHHDRDEFEVFCYASVAHGDDMTERCRAAADQWRDVAWLSDEELARRVRDDRIDILVDLAMHTGHNRLLAFARRPAPVQLTYLAYSGTTGLDAIRYRLTDPYLAPPGGDDRFYAEQSVRLPETYWCYRAPAEAPDVGPLPALKRGAVTFGSLNNFAKLSAPALAAWARLLQALPGAALVLHAPEVRHRSAVQDALAGQGISRDRVSFVGILPPAEYFRTYHHVDVALDPFPYNGATTTCDALWMGVPVVSLAGRTGVGRAGVSVLSNAGLPELVAPDVDHYVDLAASLGANPKRLAGLRATLRDRLRASPLMNETRFARNVEAAYRDMWHRFCRQT